MNLSFFKRYQLFLQFRWQGYRWVSSWSKICRAVHWNLYSATRRQPGFRCTTRYVFNYFERFVVIYEVERILQKYLWNLRGIFLHHMWMAAYARSFLHHLWIVWACCDPVLVNILAWHTWDKHFPTIIRFTTYIWYHLGNNIVFLAFCTQTCFVANLCASSMWWAVFCITCILIVVVQLVIDIKLSMHSFARFWEESR